MCCQDAHSQTQEPKTETGVERTEGEGRFQQPPRSWRGGWGRHYLVPENLLHPDLFTLIFLGETRGETSQTLPSFPEH